MPFSATWHTLLDELDKLEEGTELIAPLSHDRFRITDVQEYRVVVQFSTTEETRPLQHDQFETLYQRIQDMDGEFDLSLLPSDTDPYPAVLSLHPRFEIDEDAGVITEVDAATGTQLVDGDSKTTASERTEPEEVDVYSDTLLLVDALERHDVTDLSQLETPALVNLYTLLSDVQRDANDFRRDVADVLLDRLHHDQPVHGQYGSVQRTARRNRSLKDDADVLAVLEDAGIERERVMSVDREKVDEALDVTGLSEAAVYDVDKSEYVRKAEVDEEVKASRLQGLKDRLAASDEAETDELREEIEELEDRIDELTSFNTGREMQE
ncbi:hypothetical protein MBEHAL_2203 [Halarchaeum acidiphilum MH1-52-1]|uniref:DUF2800 domain-containing protein n=1 Tax=Halarchaeum acidiphilum MH1-52-1 TaxID=1261545 RepID=U3AF89_9EURY|nr:hypothetical protein [Halarchaeum acidiphilum]GAD53443.1 hypothetical protein MBEHAL_2203 [Halarchaeum acidiphilum MH1-52-1]